MTVRRAGITHHEAERMARRLEEAGWVWVPAGDRAGRWFNATEQTYSPPVDAPWKEATWYACYTQLEGKGRTDDDHCRG